MTDDGLSRLTSRLNAIPQKVRERVVPELVKQGQTLSSTMRLLAPVDTGKLRDSITYTLPEQSTPPFSTPGGKLIVPETTVAVTAGNTEVRYAHLVEYGTIKMHAEPFFWPAVRLTAKPARAAIRKAISKAVRENWGKGS